MPTPSNIEDIPCTPTLPIVLETSTQTKKTKKQLKVTTAFSKFGPIPPKYLSMETAKQLKQSKAKAPKSSCESGSRAILLRIAKQITEAHNKAPKATKTPVDVKIDNGSRYTTCSVDTPDKCCAAHAPVCAEGCDAFQSRPKICLEGPEDQFWMGACGMNDEEASLSLSSSPSLQSNICQSLDWIFVDHWREWLFSDDRTPEAVQDVEQYSMNDVFVPIGHAF